VGIGKQANPTLAGGGESVTYTLGLTISGPPLQGIVLTDTLPAGVSFTGFGTSPSGTVSGQAGTTLTWTLPTLSAGEYAFTYSVKLDEFLAGGEVLVNSLQMTAPSALPQTVTAPVTVTAAHLVKIGVYNEAGELVKELLVRDFSQSIDNVTLGPDAKVESLNDTIQVLYKGLVLAAWDGTNTLGDPATNGIYYIKVDNSDSLGMTTSVSMQVVVSRTLSKITANIYNAAGEVVRHLYKMVDDPVGGAMTGVDLSTGVIEPGIAAPTDPAQLEVVLQTTVGPVTLVWDGKNDKGEVVMGGHYQLEVKWDNGKGSVTEITKGVLVVGGRVPQGTAVAKPNVLTIANGTRVSVIEVNSAQGLTVRGRVYTVAGELVATLVNDPASPWKTAWDGGTVASGLYLAVVEGVNAQGGLALRQVVKIMVVR